MLRNTAFFTIVLLLITCSEEDFFIQDDSELIGKWYLADVAYEGVYTKTSDEEIITTSFHGNGSGIQFIKFMDSPNEYQSFYDYDIDMFPDNPVEPFTDTWRNQGHLGSGTWEIKGNTIVLTTNGFNNEFSLDIVSKTDEELVFKRKGKTQSTAHENIIIDYEYTGTFTFNKD